MIHSFAFSFRLQDDAHPVVEQAPEADVPPLDDIAFSNDEQVLLVLIGVHRRVGNQGRRGTCRSPGPARARGSRE